MGVSYTQEQQSVIAARNCNLLVSAAAGSGKTAVLVERIVRMVSDAENPVDIDRLLIVTFTNAAAAEMRERISAALGKRLEEEPDNAHLQRQLTLLHNAQITTIDSFCLFVIRNNFNDIGLDPGFRVADEGELKLLRGAVMEELLEAHFAQKDEAFLRCLESFHQSGDERTLTEYIQQLYDFSRSYPFPEQWLRRAVARYAPESPEEAEKTEWIAFARTDIETMLSACAAHLKAAVSVCEQPDGPYMYAPVLVKEREMIEACAGKASFTESERAFAGIVFGRLPGRKDESVSPLKRELVRGMRAEVKETLEKMRKRYFSFPLDQAVAHIQSSGRAVETLVSLTLEFGERLAVKKQEKNVLDFGDMEHYALQILLEEKADGSHVPSRAAKDYRSYFREIMIDEYQDSNLVQEYLLQSISGEEEGNYNRFMVGDVKQSIYKFRLARPEIFMEKYSRYTEEGKERKISLHRNFRSRREVTESVNHVFSRIMRRELGGISYDGEAALCLGAEYPAYEAAETELLLLAGDKEGGKSKAEQEAVMVAQRICRLMREHQVTDRESGQLRPIRYGDIAILLRTNAGWEETMQNTLKEYGIPAHTASSTGYFSSQEIRTMLHFLRILDNPLQDIPMFGVMHSMLGGFTDQEIAQIRAALPERKLYEALEAMDAAGEVPEADDKGEAGAEAACFGMDGALLRKVSQFLGLIRKYREKTAYEPVKQLLREVMAETGYLQYMTAFPEGDVRRANLEMLLLKAADFEKTGSHGLFSFIRYMEQLEKYDVEYGEAGTVDEHADVVRIMSIHKSKGLEFPVCIAAGLAKRFNIQDQAKRILMDVDLGLGCEAADPERRLRRTTLRRNILARKQQLDNLGEEQRILYVAMTRAKEKLILTACLEEPEKKLAALGMAETEAGWERQNDSVSFLTVSSAGSLLDFLLPAWERVRVIPSSALKAAEVEDAVKDQWRRRKLEDYESAEIREEWQQAFTERFSYTYPWSNLAQLYTKTTVSELKLERMTELSEGASHMFDSQLQEEYIPRFCAGEEAASGAARGSAYHRAMELLDFAKLPAGVSGEEMTGIVRSALQEFLAAGKLTGEENACIYPGRIADFLLTDAARRMMEAAGKGLLKKEQPFMLGLAADRVKPEFPSEETVLIQGIIDVYWEEDGELIVLDYKTDRVEREEELIGRYQAQLDYYAEALTRITGKKVKEKLIYSFHFHKILYCKMARNPI